MSACADFDIVIAGGGMVGASLALALGALPLRTLVVEATPPDDAAQPSYDDRATAIAESSRRILAGIGCWPELATAAARRRARPGELRPRGREPGTRPGAVAQAQAAAGRDDPGAGQGDRARTGR
jgi:2-octaprenyl-6-methoxyphenol hydroxylase